VKVLLDTCVLAELRHPSGHSGVKEAVAKLPDENLYLSVLTIGEIAKGVALLAAGKKKRGLSQWLNELETTFRDRMIEVDAATARLWGDLTAQGQQAGQTIPAVDGLIAATALRHGFHVMTRNTKHFQVIGALILDPWQDRKG